VLKRCDAARIAYKTRKSGSWGIVAKKHINALKRQKNASQGIIGGMLAR